MTDHRSHRHPRIRVLGFFLDRDPYCVPCGRRLIRPGEVPEIITAEDDRWSIKGEWRAGLDCLVCRREILEPPDHPLRYGPPRGPLDF